MSFRVRVRDFQSIEDATIEVDGLTVITGPNNSGKTALMRAVSGAFTNARGTKFVRHGKDSAKVELSFSDGRTLLWEKGEKVNRYELDGKALNRVGHGAPPETATLGILPVEAAGRELWPQFAHQFVGQVFLLDEPGSVLAEAVANVDKVGVLNESLRLSQSDRRGAASELKVRVEDVAKHEAALLLFDGLDVAVAQVKKAEKLRVEVADQGKSLDQVRGLQSRLSTAVGTVKSLAPVRTLPTVDSALVEKVKKIQSALDWSVQTSARLVQAKADHDRALDAAQSVRDWVLPDTQPVQDALHSLEAARRSLEAARALTGRLTALEGTVTGLRATLSGVESAYEAAASDVQVLFEEAGSCPFCGVEHEASSC
jgi:DNA repair exonuclease SbcCD ATPase subunit